MKKTTMTFVIVALISLSSTVQAQPPLSAYYPTDTSTSGGGQVRVTPDNYRDILGSPLPDYWDLYYSIMLFFI